MPASGQIVIELGRAASTLRLGTMSAGPAKIFDILAQADSARMRSHGTVCDLLEVNRGTVIRKVLTAGYEPSNGMIGELIIEISREIENRKLESQVTDWPFEHFWANPYEPAHSKLIAFFIDPGQKHGCGSFMLNGFLEVLATAVHRGTINSKRLFEGNGCKVAAESAYIDLRITREASVGRFAILIENKINSAVDQDRQLERYVTHLHDHSGFSYPEIFIFYLPLTREKHPNPDDRQRVTQLGAQYFHINFGQHILTWLDRVIREWPTSLDPRMREHVGQYRNLIAYLNRRQKALEMNEKIIAQLKNAEHDGKLPTLSELEALNQSVNILRQCLQHVIRGKLLLEVFRLLTQSEKGLEVWFCPDSDHSQKLSMNDPYDPIFSHKANLCISVTEAVNVCFGANENHQFWLGYMRAGPIEKQKVCEAAVAAEAQAQLTDRKVDDGWYVWAERKGIYDDKSLETTANSVAQQLISMHRGLWDRLKSGNAPVKK